MEQPKRNDPPTSHCMDCGDPIYESMGFTHAGDLVEEMEGKRPGYLVRQRCWKCVERHPLHMHPGLGDF